MLRLINSLIFYNIWQKLLHSYWIDLQIILNRPSKYFQWTFKLFWIYWFQTGFKLIKFNSCLSELGPLAYLLQQTSTTKKSSHNFLRINKLQFVEDDPFFKCLNLNLLLAKCHACLPKSAFDAFCIEICLFLFRQSILH